METSDSAPKSPRSIERVRPLRSAGSAGLLGLILGVVFHFNPQLSGPVLVVASLLNGIAWGVVFFVVVFIYQLIRLIARRRAARADRTLSNP